MSESGDGWFTTDVYSATGNLMWLVGNHNMKFGTEYRYYIEDASRFSTANAPQINFSNTWTRGPLDNSSAAPFGQDFASFLLGLPTGGTMSRPAAYREKSSVLSFFAHDDWRVGTNLTLNLGVRWEIESPLTEADNRFVSGFDFDSPLPITAAAQANYARNPIAEVPVDQFHVRGGLLYPDTGGPKAGVAAEPGERHAARRVRVADDAEDVDSRRLRPVLRRARHQPHHGQPGGLLARHGADAVDRQRADVPGDAGQPVPGRTARAGRLRPRLDDERRAAASPSPTSAT